MSLAWFFRTRRPWNPYVGDAGVRLRLEAALAYWLSRHSADGRFPSSDWRHMAATAFATKFMGETLRRLHPVPGIDHRLFERVVRAQRKAVAVLLDRDDLFERGRMIWQYARDDPAIARHLVDRERRWYEWLSYNAVREPDGSAFILNRGIESRTLHGAFTRLNTELAEVIVPARAYATTREERTADIAFLRAALADQWPHVEPLREGAFSAFSPYPFLHQDNKPWHPTQAQGAAAQAEMRYEAQDRFNHQRADDRRPLVFTYVRRPTYYAAFNVGGTGRGQCRFGLGLIWHPDAGALLQSQTGSDVAAWGTRPKGSLQVYETAITDAAFDAGSLWHVKPGCRDMPAGDVAVTYRIGAHGRKRVAFGEQAVVVQVEHLGTVQEVIPILRADGDELALTEGFVRLDRQGIVLAIRYQGRVARVVETDHRVARYQVVAIAVECGDRLEYELRIGRAH